MTFDITAVSCRTFSLGHILINYVFGGAINIAHDDGDGGDKEGLDGVRRIAKSSGGYCAAKITPPNETVALRVLQHPLRTAEQVWLTGILLLSHIWAV